MRVTDKVIIAAFMLLTACDAGEAGKVDKMAASVKERYAPDKRTVLFNVSAEKQGGQLVLKGETTSPLAKDKLFHLLDSAGIEVTDSLQVLPGDDVGKNVFGVARLSVCNLRVEPGHSAEMATQVLLGTPLKIMKDEGSWLLVQTPENYIAWTQESGLTRMDSAAFAAWQSQPKLIYTADFGQALLDPSPGQVVSDLVIGDILVAGVETGAFYKAVFPDGRTGFVKKEEAQLLDNWIGSLNPSGESVLEIARQMMGAPYLWGGTSAKGVDCSGFTKTAYFMNGIILPRDASQQVLSGLPVDIYAGDTVSIASGLLHLRKGDLIFFTNDPARQNEENARITHVGIYIENGEFIHSSGFVHRSSLLDTAGNYSKRHAKTLTKARRILGGGEENGIALISRHPLYKGN